MDTCINKLKKLRAFDKDAFIDDFTKVDSSKHLLQISIEAMLDISSHLIARNRWEKPKKILCLIRCNIFFIEIYLV